MSSVTFLVRADRRRRRIVFERQDADGSVRTAVELGGMPELARVLTHAHAATPDAPHDAPDDGRQQHTTALAHALVLLFVSARVGRGSLVLWDASTLDGHFRKSSDALKKLTSGRASTFPWASLGETHKARVDGLMVKLHELRLSSDVERSLVLVCAVGSSGPRSSSGNENTSYGVYGIPWDQIVFEPAFAKLPAAEELATDHGRHDLVRAVVQWIEAMSSGVEATRFDPTQEERADFYRDDVAKWRTVDRMVVAFVSAVDDQWYPNKRLQNLSEKGVLRGSVLVAQKTARLARAEFFRVLCTSSRVVVNRTHWLNTPALQALYNSDAGVREGPEDKRSALAELLVARAIVLFLWSGDTPELQGPVAKQARELEQSAWREFYSMQRLLPTSIKFSRDRDECQRLQATMLADRFRAFGAGVFAAWPKITSRYATRLNAGYRVDEQDLKRFRSRWAQLLDGEEYSRLVLYRELFIEQPQDPSIQPGTPEFQRYDVVKGAIANTFGSAKPHVRLCKEILDVAYNVGLPDALGLHLVTPYDSMGRAVLGTTAIGGTARSSRQDLSATVAAIIDAFRDEDVRYDVRSRLVVASFADLSVRDVVKLRTQPEHRELVDSVYALLNGDHDYTFRTQDLFLRYVRLIERATEIAGAHAPKESWTPLLRCEVSLGEHEFRVDWVSRRKTALRNVRQPREPLIDGVCLPACVRLIVAENSSDKSQRDIWFAVDIFSGVTNEAASVERALIAALTSRGDLGRGIEESVEPAEVCQQYTFDPGSIRSSGSRRSE